MASFAQNTLSVARSGKDAEPVYVFPLSFAQEQLWLVDRLLAGRPVYNMPLTLRLVGDVDADALQRALQELMRRHEALRTRFELQDGRPVQVIAPEQSLVLDIDDLRELPARERETEARREAQEAATQRFELERGPLFRARLLRLSDSEHWLMLTLHHIVTDGWSSGVMRREISMLYEAFRERRPSPLPELPVQYADYAVWQRESVQGEALEKQLAHWKQALVDLPVLELPTDRPRPAVASYRGARVVFELDEALTRGLKELRQRESSTLFMTLLAAFQVLLYRYSGQEDIAVGVPIAGRRRPELEGLIGYFVNMLVLRGDLSGEPSFRDYLGRVRARALAAYAHQDLPFARLVEELAPRRDASRNPLFQVCFSLENTPEAQWQLAGLDVSQVEDIRSQTAKFDLDFFLVERDGKIAARIEYATDLFDAPTIERMAGHWRVMLEAIVADPQQRISQLPLLTEAERRQLQTESRVATEYRSELCIHELFEAQVHRSPDATAVVFEEQRLSYAELNAQANRVAHYLRTLGVGPDAFVAIAMERSIEMIVGLLGILKAGAAYVPLDPSYPAERLAFMLEDTRAPVLLTQRRLLAQLPPCSGRTLCLDRDETSIAVQPNSNPSRSATPDNLAYVIYTSGSTGQPKGVLVTHHNVARLFRATHHWFRFDEHDAWTLFHSFAFDFSVWEMWGALLHGGRLVLVPYLVSRDPEQFHDLLVRERVTVLNQTPSAFRQLQAADAKRGGANLALRLVIFGGEAFDWESVRPWLERHGDGPPQLVNMYGITETTVHATYRPMTRADLDAARSNMIGQPIPDMGIVLLDRHRQPVPVGIPGEIFVGGAGVARGYLNRPELTAERFIADPFSQDTTARWYRSGDLARRTANGDLQYFGRTDQQVKIRGYRIELGEIEATLKQHDAIQDAVVLAREDASGDKRLVAYVVPARGHSVTADTLRAFLLGKLPDYMIPSGFATLEAFPLTVNGKVNRILLASSTPEVEPAAQAHVTPRNAVEVQLMRIWEKILDVPRIGMRDNFFALGGDSLGAVRMIDRIEQLFGRQLQLDVLWYQEGTIENLARMLVDDEPPLWSGPVSIKATGKRRPLFCPHIVGGHMFFYDNLARHLVEDQPLYGLPARGVDGKEAPDTRIEAMAANCIGSMKQVQPRGPYRLAGYCSGGLIAFEMARQLHGQGDTVELLALCDSLAPGFHPLELARTAWAFLRLRNVRLVQQRLYRFVLQNLGLSHLREFRTVTEAHYWAQLSYRPQPYSGRAVLFRAANTGISYTRSLGWDKFATAGVDVCVMPAGHGAMMKEPMVRVLAEKLETYLAGAGLASPEPEMRPMLVDA